MLATITAGLIAMQPIQTWPSRSVLGVIGLTWLFGCRRTKGAVYGVAPGMLIPYGWLLLLQYPWNAYRWSWVMNWAVLPGFLPMRGIIVGETGWLVAAAVLTSGLFLSAVTVIRFFPATRVWMWGIVWFYNSIFSFLLYRAFGA